MGSTTSRRRLLATASAGLIAPFAGRFMGTAWGADMPVVLTAGKRSIEVNGRAAAVFGISQPDGTSGLTTEVGTPFRVTLRNEAGVETLIHWHGLTPPYQQDGVPGVSAPAVAPGGTAHYDFPLTFPGTFWMHSHQGLQEQSLMSAPLIIRPRATSADRQEVVLMLHDFSFRAPEEIYAGLRGSQPAAAAMAMPGMSMPGMSMPGMAMGSGQVPKAGMADMKMDLNDVAYDAFLANDRTLADPQVIRVEPGGRILLRVINASATSGFHIDLGQTSARLVAVDGRPIEPLGGTVFPVATAQRLDLEFEMPAGQTALPVMAVLEGERKRTGIILATAGATVAKMSDMAEQATAPLDLMMEQSLRAVAPLSSKPADRTHTVDLTGAMEGYVWGLNGVEYGQDKPLMVASGQRVEMVMRNSTMMAHPMHLHGHAFQVAAIDGQRFSGAVRDTVLVPPMKSVTIAFDADNPGRWAFHCHNLYHMEAGMMTTVQYENL
ncbi:multicopper oxidase family protein [Acidiphilium sp.]|uniref:multicopper oxidase family protein n=1 Tax=Acidiphilium sp. TaxID=527 RepID=UPI00258BA101|nr:multicopper oxidase domain-containing protein [Acidiphilium sp.]